MTGRSGTQKMCDFGDEWSKKNCVKFNPVGKDKIFTFGQQNKLYRTLMMKMKKP